MQRINVNIRPSNGYVFKDTDGSMHRGKSWPFVIAKVRAYRERQGLNVETVEAEVMAQACERYPSLCRPPGDPRPAPNAAPHAPVKPIQPAMTLKTHVLLWLNRLLKRKEAGETLEFVPPAEASARAVICNACPFNQPFIIKGCGSCKIISGEYRDAVVPGKTRHSGLGGCLLLGVDNVTSVHLNETRVQNDKLPSVCWRKIVI